MILGVVIILVFILNGIVSLKYYNYIPRAHEMIHDPTSTKVCLHRLPFSENMCTRTPNRKYTQQVPALVGEHAPQYVTAEHVQRVHDFKGKPYIYRQQPFLSDPHLDPTNQRLTRLPLNRQVSQRNPFLRTKTRHEKIGHRFAPQGGPTSSSPNTNTSDTSHITAIIEGFGPFLLIIRASSEQNSLVPSVFVRDVGFFRCFFQGGGAKKIGGSRVSGAGFYQCFYQRPGNLLTVRQGVGQYFCFFQGIRSSKGFVIVPTPPPGSAMMAMEKRNFVEFLGSVGYNVVNSADGSPLGQFQLLGIYNYGPEGSGRNFGLVQGKESYHINFESLTTSVSPSLVNKPLATTADGLDILIGLPSLPAAAPSTQKSNKTVSSQVAVDQSGLFQYHFNGAEFDAGRAAYFQSYVYNFVRTYDAHLFTLLFVRYEIGGQGQDFAVDDRDFVQIWGLYKYNLQQQQVKVGSTRPAYLQAIVVAQFDLFGNPFGDDDDDQHVHGLDYLQVVLRYSQIFAGFEPSDTFAVTLTGAYQRSSASITESAVMTTDDPFADADYFLSIAQLLYTFAKENGMVNGFVQIYVIYQLYLDEEDPGPAAEASPGYLQLLGQYSKTYVPFTGKKHSGTWTLQGITEFVVPDVELSNGFIKIQGQLVFDTTGWFDGMDGLKPAKPSTITLLGLYQCIWFGLKTFRPFCYFQLYAYYSGTIPGSGGNSGQGVLLVQYYQETSR